jgi:hypothetical protein
MFHLLSSGTAYSGPTIVGVYPSFEAAEAAAYALLPVAYYDLDVDNDGCADLITDHGSIYSIEPAARRAA